jgi:hypothetical protein
LINESDVDDIANERPEAQQKTKSRTKTMQTDNNFFMRKF